MKTNKKKMEKIIRGASAAAGVLMLTTIPAFAENEYAKAGATWILDGIFWVAIVAGIWGATMTGIKRNFTAMIGIIAAAAIVCLFCSNPDIIINLGNNIKGILGL